MSLLNEASFLVTPNGYKEDKLYAAIPTNGNGDMTVTRATAATRVDENGLVSSVASNVPRIDYTDGGCPSILLEPRRTNLLTYSEQFDNAAWGKTRCTIDENSTNSPNGTLTADTLIGNSVAGENYIYLSQNATIGVPNVLSVYIKPIDITLVSLVSFTQAGRASFSLVGSGSVTFENGICTNSTIESLPNGWYRISTKITPTATASNNIGIATSALGIVGNCFYIWGAQLEEGAYPTSYIPTTTATVTRNADVLSRDNIYTNNLIVGGGGTWFVHLINNTALIRDIFYYSVFLGTGSTGDASANALTFTFGGSTAARATIRKKVSSVEATLYSTTTDTAKILFKWNGASADVFVNGAKVVSATLFNTTAMEHLGASGNDTIKYIKQMALFARPLTDAQCIALTTL